MTDLAERLRSWANAQTNNPDLLREAAAEIERLQTDHDKECREVMRLNTHINKLDAEIKRLRAELDDLKLEMKDQEQRRDD